MAGTVSTADTESETQAPAEASEVCYPELGEYLTSEYEILRRVFSYLPLDDLTKAEGVCKAWKSAAEATKKARTWIESFVVSEQKYKMGKIWTEAVFSMTFCSAPNAEVEDQVFQYINPNGNFILFVSRAGVIGTTSDLSRIAQLKGRVGFPLAPKKSYVTSLRFPHFPNVGYKTLFWDETYDIKQFNSDFFLPDGESIKCLLILTTAGNGPGEKQKNEFLSFLRTWQKESFAVGGCIVDKCARGRSCGSSSVNVYVIFYGKKVEAVSTVLTSDVKSLGSIDNKVEELKKVCPQSSCGVLFIFRCAGRQRVLRMYKPKNNDITKWEGDTISKYFPNTPVFGCFGYGEFGNEFPSNLNMVSLSKRFRRSDTWEYSFSTSLVYVGFTK